MANATNDSIITTPSSDLLLVNRDAEIDEILNDANELIESVYRRLDMERVSLPTLSVSTPESHLQPRRIDFVSPGNTPSPSSSASIAQSPNSTTQSSFSPISPTFQMQIERINLFCDSVNRSLSRGAPNSNVAEIETVEVVPDADPTAVVNLTSSGLALDDAVAAATNENDVVTGGGDSAAAVCTTFIDLSESQPSLYCPPRIFNNRNNTDNDVIILDDEVVDLCTPARETATHTRRRRTENSRRSFTGSLPPVNFSQHIRQNNLSSTPIQMQGSSPRSRGHNCLTPRRKQNQKKAAEKNDSATVASTTVVKTSVTGESNASFTCPVCMDSFVNREPTSTKCGHIFCAACIKEAVRISHKCPLCNTKLTPRMLLRIYLF